MKKKILIFLTLLLLPASAYAMVDLKIDQSDIKFSTETLIAGEQVRIYASIYNVGDEDVSGYVSFYQGSVLIDDSLVISVLANGNPEEVYIDFVVPSGKFNILAIIRGTDPQDENENNNSAITKKYQPIFDDDRDEVENDVDNCPSVANESQNDTDGDGDGDACDDDDDNDGLTDEVEQEIGTNTTNTDTDGDGVSDPDDAYPTDSEEERVVVAEETSEVEDVHKEQQEDVINLLEEIVAEVVDELEGVDSSTQDDEITTDVGLNEDSDAQEAIVEVIEEDLTISTNTVFSYSRESWDTFTFQVLAPSDSQRVYEWDFGDGITSSKTTISHTFSKSGTYEVLLTSTSASGEISQETAKILVPFFTLNNRLILASVILLVLLLFGSCGASCHLTSLNRGRKKNERS